MPFAPATALLLNFFLMAQYDAKTHGYLGGLVALAVGCYAWTKSAGAGGVATPQQHRR